MKRRFLSLGLALLLLLSACGSSEASPETTASAEQTAQSAETEAQTETAPDWEELEPESSLELAYAQDFSVDCYSQGYRLITMDDGTRCFVVPEDAAVPENLPEDVVLVQQPLESIYLVSSAAMDYFRELDSIGSVRLTGTKAENWYIQEAVDAIEAGTMYYAGKYSTPDYELILSEGCDLAIENTMINHTPEVKEELESLGIPVVVERSSYESHPLGRIEWLKFYGVLLGKEAEAEAAFAAIEEELTPVLEQESTGKTVAFFSINANGSAIIRKPGDYVAKAIALAGGLYAFANLTPDEDNAQATMNLQMESFYAGAKDADILIYNSTIDSELQNMEQLLEKSSLLADFKAVQAENVWCVGKNLYQESMSLGDLILDIHAVCSDPSVSDEELTFLRRLEFQ